jgi:hypothetical protein
MKPKKLLEKAFNPRIFSAAFAFVSFILFILIMLCGVDAGLPISRGSSSQWSAHYRTILLYSILASYALHIYGRAFKSHLVACYLSVVTVLGCYGASEFLYAFPQAMSGFITLGNFVNDMFYWVMYLFQLGILYLFTSKEINATEKEWTGNLKAIAILVVASLPFFLASALPWWRIGFQVSHDALFALNYAHKATLTLAFMAYLRGWRK